MHTILMNKLYSVVVFRVVVLCGLLLAGLGTAYAQEEGVTPRCLPHNDQRDYLNIPQCVNTVSDSPAATLLLPYFEVDTRNPTGRTTIFTINNSSPTAVLTHVTIWSELSVAVFNFNVYLTGYDTQIINLRDVINGKLPQTATAGQDPFDTISPKGPFSQDINFPGCSPTLSVGGKGTINTIFNFSYPFLPPPPMLPAGLIQHMQASLIGAGSPLTPNEILCAGTNHGDVIARGYVTIDTVDRCSSQFPGFGSYIESYPSANTGDIAYQNDLTGEAYYMTGALISVGNYYATSQNPSVNLVHVVADQIDPATTTAGDYTFYGRYDNWDASDRRQPLATSFMARFMNNANLGPNGAPVPNTDTLGAGPELIVWRDSKVIQGYFACSPSKPPVLPTWYPLGQEGIVAFDEQEHPQLIQTKPFPAETQVVRIGSSVLPVTFASGWIFLDLNTFVSGESMSLIDSDAAQAWVEVVDTYGAIRPAQHLDSATDAWHFVPPGAP